MPSVSVPEGMDNFSERRMALESQQKRDPSTTRVVSHDYTVQ
jgi:hypothetical protein